MGAAALLCGFASPALAAGGTLACNGTLTGSLSAGVVVPPNAVCVLTNATVPSDVNVEGNGYFEADNTKILGNVLGDHAETVYIHDGSRVGGKVETLGGAQLFVYNSAVNDDIRAENLTNKVEICGSTVSSGGIDVEGLHAGGPGDEILIGDPLTAGCPGNTVGGGINVESNFTDVYFVIRGNALGSSHPLSRGNLSVTDNTGPSHKFVQSSGGQTLTLRCSNIGSPVVGGPSGTFWSIPGQCF
jgi:hypothetical protein